MIPCKGLRINATADHANTTQNLPPTAIKYILKVCEPTDFTNTVSGPSQLQGRAEMRMNSQRFLGKNEFRTNFQNNRGRPLAKLPACLQVCFGLHCRVNSSKALTHTRVRYTTDKAKHAMTKMMKVGVTMAIRTSIAFQITWRFTRNHKGARTEKHEICSVWKMPIDELDTKTVRSHMTHLTSYTNKWPSLGWHCHDMNYCRLGRQRDIT